MRSPNNLARAGRAEYLNWLRDAVHSDAIEHGLWNRETKYEAAFRIADEVDELIEAPDRDHYVEELADVIIMALSVAGHLNINIHEAVMMKMAINVTRPYRHEVIEK